MGKDLETPVKIHPGGACRGAGKGVGPRDGSVVNYVLPGLQMPTDVPVSDLVQRKDQDSEFLIH